MSRMVSARVKQRESADSVVRRCKCRRVLRVIETELEELREQNRLLTDSARFFADLSERLNAQLRQHRSQDRLG